MSDVRVLPFAEKIRSLDRPTGGCNDGGMEARIAKLESDVEYFKHDIGEIKSEVKEVRVSVQSHRDDFHAAKIWALMLYIAMAGILLGVMAKGFHWL